MAKQIIQGNAVPAQIWTEDMEPTAKVQIHNVASLPIVGPHIAVMPDAHAGIGCTVGSVIPTRKAVIPASVGVDLGCGMVAAGLSLTAGSLPNNLKALREGIEKAVPVGFAAHSAKHYRKSPADNMADGLDRILAKHPKVALRRRENVALQMGTLGGGNHFIELCLDENNRVWVMLHSGSRGIGNSIGTYFISRAKEYAKQQGYALPDKNLAWLDEGTDLFADYMEAVDWAQQYAALNRAEMMRLVLAVLKEKLPPFTIEKDAVNCHHNYVQKENHYGEPLYITRKGAIRAGKGELGIIPGSMGTKSYIVRGLGEEASFCSCSHGAGRRMSRAEAKHRFSNKDLVAQTQGVECRKDKGVVDEIPAAYKDIDQVMANQQDLVTVEHTLKQVLCVKG